MMKGLLRCALVILALLQFITGCGGTLKLEVVNTTEAAISTQTGPTAAEGAPPEPSPTMTAALALPTDEPSSRVITAPVWPEPVKEVVKEAGRWQVLASANQVDDLAVGNGLLWVATEGGLVRWDVQIGQRSQVYPAAL
jgi:hypothetical protein